MPQHPGKGKHARKVAQIRGTARKRNKRTKMRKNLPKKKKRK